ncbi:hypothetical protein OE88DRAFT_1654019 [Heliocybe sulcata]|uniref:Uncharacterized protein n=1 Tax=Heliocybe sulcata TaxID=5364 RepID=A0A5C3ND40_9AGAM|nr:hypothetical protein OE88DRAFT_1654019 [Heliocybe sulcata]
MTRGLRLSTLFQRKANHKTADVAVEVEISRIRVWEGAELDEHHRQGVDEELSRTMQLGDPLTQCLCPAWILSRAQLGGTPGGSKIVNTSRAATAHTARPRRRAPDEILHDGLTAEILELHNVSAHRPYLVSSVTAVPSQATIMVLPDPSASEVDAQPLHQPISMTSALLPPVDHLGTLHKQMAHELFFLDAALPESRSYDRLSISTESTLFDDSEQPKEAKETSGISLMQVQIPRGRLFSTEEIVLPNPYDGEGSQ